MPRNLVSAAAHEGRQAWLASVPAAVRELEIRWSLDVGPPFQPGGQTAWVAPATADGRELVLKIAWPHTEAAHEADGLRVWDGNGTVLLVATAELADARALLLERCRPGITLAGEPEEEQDLIITGLLRRLWRPRRSGHPFRPLQQMCDEWADGFERKTRDRPLPDPGLARQAMALFRGLPASANRQVLLCTDLHAENVLAAQREPWLAIDPKPYVGDPTYDALQHLLNCRQRLHRDPAGLCRRLAGLLGLDAERLLLWLFARCVQEAPGCPALLEVARRIAPA